MSEVLEILKATHEIFKGSGKVAFSVDERGLGMAYAVPIGLDVTNYESYGPWHEAELKQVFYQDSLIFQSVLAEIQFIMRWRYSEAKQYIIEVFLTPSVIFLDPTVNVDIVVHFGLPHNYDNNLEAWEIPFEINVLYNPVGGVAQTNYKGNIRADGEGSFKKL